MLGGCILKKWYFVLIILCLSLGTIYAFPFLENAITSPAPKYVRQVITADSTSSRTISWQTDPTDAPQFIEYKPLNSETMIKKQAITKILTTDLGNFQLHSLTLTELIPNTTYRYRVGSDGAYSDWYTLSTAAKESNFSALIFPDSQCSDYTVWGDTVTSAITAHPTTQFFINMGDLVDNGASFYQWQAWLEGAKPLLPLIPIAPIEGNHEAYSLEWEFTLPTLYLALFDLPQNGAKDLLGQTYSFDYGDVHFVVLDSQEKELDAYQPDLTAKQIPWLNQDLAATTKKWKIILIHRGLFSHPDTANLNNLGKAFIPIFDQHHVDIVFSAHIHSYGRTKPLYQGVPAENGTIYISTGRSGDKTWESSLAKPYEVIFDRALDQPNYLILNVTSNTLTVTAQKQDSTIIDTFEIKK